MYHTKNNVPQNRREEMVALLNERLADLIDLRLQAKQAHWNITGPNFFALHQLFDKIADVADEAADGVAERAVALAGIARGTLASVAARTQLLKYSEDQPAGSGHVFGMVMALSATAGRMRTAIDISAKGGDAGTSDLFTGILREVEKVLWMVEAHERP